MKERKIVLSALNAKYVHSNLAVYDLEAYCRKKWEEKDHFYISGKKGKEDAQCACLQLSVMEFTINHNLDFILQELYRKKADVYAFSCYIWNIYEILSVARELKKLLKQTEIWLGGPEVSYDAENYLEKNPFINGVILGEGEVTFYELTNYWNYDGNSLSVDIPGIVYRAKDGKILRTGKRPLMNLDELPFVYEDLERFQNKILYYETSRGCPFSCSYCLSSIEKQVRFRSFSIVKEELAFFLENQVPQVKFVDRTFNCNKKHALQIWNYLYEHDNGMTNFHFEIAADLIGEEELSLFKKMRPGLIQLEIGLQSTNPKTIEEIRRVMDVEKVRNTLLKIRSYGNIHQHLDLIAGLPYEDFSSFQKSFNDAYEMKPDQLQLGFLKVLKGSYMGEQTENYELSYREVQPYEVLCTKWLSYDDILVLKQVEEMVELYYNSDQFRYTVSFLISFFPDAFVFYQMLGTFYQKNDLYGIGMKREMRYQVLRDFALEYFVDFFERENMQKENIYKENMYKENTHKEMNVTDIKEFKKIFDSLLTFDYYLRENAKKRPVWSEKEPIEKEKYLAFFKNGGNEEISLLREGYDSKAAARGMHIEPIVRGAYLHILYEDGRKEIEDEILEDTEGQKVYCLFEYEKANAKAFALENLQNRQILGMSRKHGHLYEKTNPLTKDANVTFLRGL